MAIAPPADGGVRHLARHQVRRRLGSLARSEGAGGAALFIAPALLALLLFRVMPAVYTALASLETPTGLGLENYRYMVTSGFFLQSVQTTLIFSLIVNPLQVVLALGLAVLFQGRFPGVGFTRTMVFLPTAVPLAVASIVWGVAFRPDSVVNALLVSLGLGPQPFLTSPEQALLSIVVLLSWVGVGYWMMFLIAGLHDIPEVYYEAAAVDGAGPVRCFFSITLPLLRRPLAFVTVAATVANFVIFAPVQILTDGGPQGATNLVMYEAYQRAYAFADLPLASAEVLALLVVMIVVVGVQFRLLRSET